MVEAIFQSTNNLNNHSQEFSQKKRDRRPKKQQEISDMFPTAEVMRENKEKKFKEQLDLTHRIQSLEKAGNKAVEYLKVEIDRNFHMVNIVVPDDIIVRSRSEHEVDILA